jgi:hypothetical protein
VLRRLAEWLDEENHHLAEGLSANTPARRSKIELG